MALANTPDLHVGEDALYPGAKIVWTQPDGARVFCQVVRVNRDRGVTHLRCYHGGRVWSSRQPFPLRPSMKLAEWPAAELLETTQ